jgi:hypothetical protein
MYGRKGRKNAKKVFNTVQYDAKFIGVDKRVFIFTPWGRPRTTEAFSSVESYRF